LFFSKAVKRAQSLLFQTQPNKQNILKAGYRMVGLICSFWWKNILQSDQGRLNYCEHERQHGLDCIAWPGMGNLTEEVVLLIFMLVFMLIISLHCSLRVGIAVMLHLLVDTSIFVSLPNGCLCQMTGEPFIIPPGDFQNAITKSTEKYLKRTLSIENNEELPSKRRKLESGKTRRDTYKIKT